jgi:hypothetical protein
MRNDPEQKSPTHPCRECWVPIPEERWDTIGAICPECREPLERECCSCPSQAEPGEFECSCCKFGMVWCSEHEEHHEADALCEHFCSDAEHYDRSAR